MHTSHSITIVRPAHNRNIFKKGFLLLEMLMAAALLGIALSIGAAYYWHSIKELHATRQYMQALSRARQTLDEIKHAGALGNQVQTSDVYTISSSLNSYQPTSELRMPDGVCTLSKSLFIMSAQVTWFDISGQQRTIQLSSLYVAPEDASTAQVNDDA